MFRTRNETKLNYQEYRRLQQQDDGDDDVDIEDWSDLAQHPNSVLVINTLNVNDQGSYTTAVLPHPIFKSTHTNDTSDNSDTLPAIPTGNYPHQHSLTTTDNTTAPSSSFLPNDTLAKLPQATRDFFNNKWLPSKANKATLANMHPTIINDIQQGNIPSHADPTLRELDSRGWTIAHRRLYYIKKEKKKKKKKSRRTSNSDTVGGDTTDDDGHYTYLDPLQPSNQLYGSIFIKTNYDTLSLPVSNMENEETIPINKDQYQQIVESVQLAINDNIQPTRISQGSSGSYFCRNRDNKIVGVFKPKNEEPYGKLNPKWTKWLHRHLFPCFFGRSCLIPNLGYISEAAASLVDRQLGTCIVPTTHLDHFTSPSFHYDYLDRRRYRHSPQQYTLPLKIGSFQCFLHGFRDANVFLRDNPWPLETLVRGDASALWGACLGQSDGEEENGDDDYARGTTYLGGIIKNKSGYQQVQSGKDQPHASTTGDHVALNIATDNTSDEGNDSDTIRHDTSLYRKKHQKPAFVWTPHLQYQFKLEFEKLVILDYLIRNTDRGLDNWMIRYCEGQSTYTTRNNTSSSSTNNSSDASLIQDNHHHEHRPTGTIPCIHGNATPHIHIAAIDNGLAFPFKHPDEWRSYPYGWLALPNSLIAQPFSADTRRRFLPILSDPIWWQDTVEQLRQLFQVDSDFNERMFQRQMAVLKGQGYNLVRVLKDAHAGPLDMVTMERVLVNQEEIFIEFDEKRLAERSPLKQQRQQGSTIMTPSETSSLSDRPATALPLDLPSSTAVGTTSSSMPIQRSDQQQDDAILQSPLSMSPSSGQASQKKSTKNGTRRLRPKRSTSFNTFEPDTPSSTSLVAHRNNDQIPWKDRVRKRLSLDLGQRRLTLRQALGSDGYMVDDDDLTIDSLDDQQEPVRKRVLIVMETIKLVKSKLPYFTCC
ncbi:phosphatidylinositol 3 and 4-kinase-domain-containing protein [Chlamydoabsidia padenii]|nr:phosphatidylinositol 3 and 4-kinase-domain-containing protein [Chlamydoabsidia padenii]